MSESAQTLAYLALGLIAVTAMAAVGTIALSKWQRTSDVLMWLMVIGFMASCAAFIAAILVGKVY
jgi:hypothetical protein